MNPNAFKPLGKGSDHTSQQNLRGPSFRSRALMRAKIADVLPETSFFDKNLKRWEEVVVTELENVIYDNATTEEYRSPKTLKNRVEMFLRNDDFKTAIHRKQSETLSIVGGSGQSHVYQNSSGANPPVAHLSNSASHAQSNHRNGICSSDLKMGSPIKRQRVVPPQTGNHPDTVDLPTGPKRSRTESSPCRLNKWGGFLVAPLPNQTCSSAGSHQSRTQAQSPPSINSEAGEAPIRKEFILTKEQIREHLSSLRSLADQCESDDNTGSDMSECQLCGLNQLVFAPKPKYCSCCGAPIKRKVNYYCTPDEDSVKHCFCSSCFIRSRGGVISAPGKSISKATLCKKKNDDEREESWVQCDKCEGWQHQICGLFNEKSDLEEKKEYKCPKCWLEEMESGDYTPSSAGTFFSAKDLKRTVLSNHIEHRLYMRLKQDREERAKAEGKSFDEVPGAEDLHVRVVLSVKKNWAVKEKLMNLLRDENHPAEFPYTAKLILLFQKIGGLDVCLFSMYVQEYGTECSRPNQRFIYISYIDSVKYFTPNIGASTGEALRTLVYHEVLIGYLDYVKRRGFTTCYLWACPPGKGNEYVLYCHPETQKTPKPDRLRQWYHTMVKKAADEDIVVSRTTLYDRLFTQTGELNCKMTAARFPYFDGDYWPVTIENLLKDIEIARKKCVTKATKKAVTKTSLKAMGLSNPSDAVNTDVLLMQKLGQALSAFKEDFIMIDLQYFCNHCNEPIVSGKRYSDRKNSHLCERCHALDTGLSSKRDPHLLSQVSVDVPSDTKDEDDPLDNDLCENRNEFLSFCQSNQYQFDTLRRAKHSSMMILFHLRHLAEPTMATTSCRICHKEGVAGQGWSCEICPGFNVCAACYQEKGGSCHIHNLTQPPPEVDPMQIHYVALSDTQKVELLEILQHANLCPSTEASPCSQPLCIPIKAMFSHAGTCNVQANGGCLACQKAWYALRVHSQRCTQQHCRIPYCKILQPLEALEGQTRL